MVFGVIALFVCMSFVPSVAVDTVKKPNMPTSVGETLYVGGTGEDNYTKIQDAIDNASDGDTVFVYDDSSPYKENIDVYKSINLIGEDKYTTEIIPDWSGNNYIVKLSADFVNINGFLINTSYGLLDFSIILESCNNNITENLIKGDYGQYWGIYISDYSNNNNIIGNIISDWEVGIYQKYSSNNIISNNIISSNKYLGMYFYSSSNNTIMGNNFSKNEHDLKLHNSNNNIVTQNIFSDTRCCICIDIRCSSNNKITYNNITQNGWGGCISIINHSFNNIISDNNLCNSTDCIRIWYSSCNNTILNNSISNNEHCIYMEELSNNNTIYHNNFINNSKKAYDVCNNVWDDGKYGNYWSDYKLRYPDAKPKLLKPWMWNTPYEIEGGNNTDNCPLINQWPISKPRTITRNNPSNFNLLGWLFDRFPLLEVFILRAMNLLR